MRKFAGVPYVLVTASLCMLSLAAHAGTAAQKYVEVWNPPESQLTKGKVKTRSAISVQGKKKHKNPAVKRVADKTTMAAPTRSRTEDKPSTKQTPLLPPLIGPDGRVLRVGYSGA